MQKQYRVGVAVMVRDLLLGRGYRATVIDRRTIETDAPEAVVCDVEDVVRAAIVSMIDEMMREGFGPKPN